VLAGLEQEQQRHDKAFWLAIVAIIISLTTALVK
jgi:hypothetical protein